MPLKNLQHPPIALQDNTDYFQYPSFFFRFQTYNRTQVPEATRVNYKVTHKKVCYTLKELLGFSNLYRQKSKEHVWVRILRVWDNDGRNIKLDQAKFIHMCPLSKAYAKAFVWITINCGKFRKRWEHQTT